MTASNIKPLAGRQPEPQVRGWCPTALQPMETGDGLLVRVRPRLGELSVIQLNALAYLAACYGNGDVDLTSRACLQIRGVERKYHASLLAELQNARLVDPAPEIEQSRNIVVSPFRTAQDGTAQLYDALANLLAQRPPLPGKFGFVLDLGPTPVLRTTAADIRIERADDGLHLVYADGAAKGVLTKPEATVDAVRALIEWFRPNGGGTAAHGRMRTQFERGAALPQHLAQVDVPPHTAIQQAPGNTTHGWLLAPEFGRLTGTQLKAIASTGETRLRLTPWRMLLVSQKPALKGDNTFITEPADPRLRIAACVGAPQCAQAHRPTRPLARRIASALRPGQTAHISGCAKGCAQRRPADVTVVARADGFSIAENASANTPAPAIASNINDVLQHVAATLRKAM